MKIYKTQTMDEMELPDNPVYTKSIAGGPYTKRLAGVDVTKNMFQKVKTVEISTTLTGNAGGVTYYHELGYKPYVIGSYVMINPTVSIAEANYPAEYRGLIPENRYPDYGTGFAHCVYVSYVDEEELRIRIFTGVQSAKVTFRLNLLREPTVE